MKVSGWASVKFASMKERKEKSRFLTMSGSVGRQPFWKVPLCILILFYKSITIVRTITLKSVPRLSYFPLCNVLHIWTIQAIPTYEYYVPKFPSQPTWSADIYKQAIPPPISGLSLYLPQCFVNHPRENQDWDLCSTDTKNWARNTLSIAKLSWKGINSRQSDIVSTVHG